jgi:hypothetical protein
MSNLLLMNAVLALSSTHVVTNAATPIWLEPISAAYQDCLFGVIDRQYETKRFSEGRALSQCANVRRVQKARAIAAVVIMGGAHRGERMVDREFVRLDDMARAIVGHIRSRYEGGMIQAAAPAPDADSRGTAVRWRAKPNAR